MTRVLRLVGFLALASTLAVAAGCSSTVTGRGGASGSPTGSPTRTASALASTSPSPGSSFARTPLSTAIGDPVTADLCAEVPLTAFDGFGYAAAYRPGVVPPGCAVDLRRSGQIAFTIYAYGVGSNSFSHLTPTSVSNATPIRTRTEDGINIAEYAFDAKDGGSCSRDVLAQGLTLSVFSMAPNSSAKPDEKADCGAADTMASLMARVASKGSVPRLRLADQSVTDLDFCAVLRATKISDIDGFAAGRPKQDGVGDGCEVSPDSTFVFYVDFTIRSDPHPDGSKAVTVGGHLLYRSKLSGSDQCAYASTQGRLPGGYEVISVYAAASHASAPTDLCGGVATATARFLDTAGLK